MTDNPIRVRLAQFHLLPNDDSCDYTDKSPCRQCNFLLALLLSDRAETTRVLREAVDCPHTKQAKDTFSYISCDCGTLLNYILKTFDRTAEGLMK